jgi:hypothetical protein
MPADFLKAFSGVSLRARSNRCCSLHPRPNPSSIGSGVREIGLNFFGASTGGLLLYGIDPERDLLVREYNLAQGRFLSASGDEVVLVRSFAEENDIQIGQSIEVLTGKSIERLSVVGVIEKEGLGKLNNGAFGVMPIETAQKYFYRQEKLDQIDVLVSGNLSPGINWRALKKIYKPGLVVSTLSYILPPRANA